MRTTRLSPLVAAVSVVVATALLASACGGEEGPSETNGTEAVLAMPPIDDEDGLTIDGEVVADADLLDAARKETVRWVTAAGAESAELTAQRFEAETGVDIQMTRLPSTELNERVLSEVGVGRLSSDVVTIYDPALAAGLADHDVFTPDTELPNYDNLTKLDGVVHEDGNYFTAYYPVSTFAYNNKKITEDEAPQSWNDLLDPKWKGRIGIITAGAGGNTVDLVAFQETTLGKDYWPALADQKPRLFDTTSVMVEALARGEVDIITAGFNTPYAVEQAGAPISMGIPEEGVSGSYSLQGLTTAGKDNSAAQLFMNWTMSKSGQEFAAAQGYVAVRPDVEQVPTGKYELPKVDDDAFVLTPMDETERTEVVSRWNTAFGIEN